YTDLIQGDSVDGGRPQKKRITELEANVSDRFRVLERAKKRAEWVKWQETQKVEKEEQDEKEKVAYAQIDWHDFVVVETVVFDERDEQAELPAPTTKNDLQSASLEQKAAMSIAPNRRIEEAMPTFDDYDTFYGSTQQQQQQMPPPQQPYTPQPVATAWRPPPGQDDDVGRLAEVRADRDRARAAQEAARHAPPSVKVRDSATFASRAQKGKAGALPPNTSICPNCHQPIPNNEMERHMKIELLDPQWRDQNRINQHRSSTTNLSTQDVANNLKRLASQRSDVFDPVTGASVDVDEAEAIRRRRAELGGYDGVSGVPSPAALGGMGLQQQTMEAMQQQGQVGQQGHVGQTRDVQEQIRQLHQRYKG
ncbi:SF3a splicing factor complex subunit, partial [Friedmanniomyces endolithicus]